MPPRMNDNTSKVLPLNSGVPQEGQPFNYSTCVDSIQIPRFIYENEKLLPCARLLWGVIRRAAYKSGKCFASDKYLCAELHVCDRQLRRYSQNLVKAGLLRVTERPGKTTCRELLWVNRATSRDECEEEDMSIPPPPSSPKNAPVSHPTDAPVFLSSLVRTSKSVEVGLLSPGSSLYLRGSLEEPPPQTPPPGCEIVCNPTYSAPGGGASDPTSARVNGPPAPRATKTPERSIQAQESRGRPNPSKPQPTEEMLTQEELIRTLYYHYVRSMPSAPPIELIEAIAKILRARRIDDTTYKVKMLTLTRSPEVKVDEQMWLKIAVEWP